MEFRIFGTMETVTVPIDFTIRYISQIQMNNINDEVQIEDALVDIIYVKILGSLLSIGLADETLKLTL